jgi:hypothetical protein
MIKKICLPVLFLLITSCNDKKNYDKNTKKTTKKSLTGSQNKTPVKTLEKTLNKVKVNLNKVKVIQKKHKKSIVKKNPVIKNSKSLNKLNEKFVKIFNNIKTLELPHIDRHFYVSVEYHHDLWFPYIKGLGGAYIGIGADQNYTMAAISNAKVVFLMDYDRNIIYLHQMYMILTRKFDNPNDLINFFKDKNNFQKNLKFLYAETSKLFPEAEPKKIEHLFRIERDWLIEAHKKYAKNSKTNKTKSWITTKSIYKKWRKLVLENRVFPVLGDLRLGYSLTEIGKSLRKTKIPARVIYLSNAEDYWKFYSRKFKNAFYSLPYDKKSLFLRTTPLRYGPKYRLTDYYHYSIQSASGFVLWLKKKKWLQVKDMVVENFKFLKGKVLSRTKDPKKR